MSPEQLRRALHAEYMAGSLSELMAKEVVLIAKEMGWTIEYVMEMDVKAFNAVSAILAKFYEDQNRIVDQSKTGNTWK